MYASINYLRGGGGKDAVPLHGVLPPTGPQINSLGIHFCHSDITAFAHLSVYTHVAHRWIIIVTKRVRILTMLAFLTILYIG